MAQYLKGPYFLRLYSATRFSVRFCSSDNRKGLVLGVYSGDKDTSIQLSPVAEEFNKQVQGKLLEQIKLSGNKVKPGKSFIFWGLDKEFAAVSVVGISKKRNSEDEYELRNVEKENVRLAVAAGVKSLDAAGVKHIFVDKCGDPESAAEAAVLSSWKYQEFKTKKDQLPTLQLFGSNNDLDCDQWNKGAIKARSQNIAGVKSLDAAGVKHIFVDKCGDPESAAEAAVLSSWKYQEFKTKKDQLPTLQLFGSNNDLDCDQWNKGAIKARSQNIARKLADTPANLLTPTIFAEQAQELLTPLGIDVKVYDQKWAEDQKMYSFLAVAKGSVEPPKFLEITYNKKDEDPYVLVGKGVTFDAGGISLKPSANMDQMRADMSGAACVVATAYGLAKLNVCTNVKILVPLVENLPSGSAIKPGDVIFARNGKSICVDNTDAEGRLILADALCYSGEFKPQWVLDIATLTGAMMVALGDAATGVFSNSNKVYQCLEAAGIETGDRVWRMPLWKHYTNKITKNPAYDLNNIGQGRGGGSCTAAAFLKEFVPEKTSWLHLDIAGVMGPENSEPYLSKGMSGRPTRTLIEFIQRQSYKT